MQGEEIPTSPQMASISRATGVVGVCGDNPLGGAVTSATVLVSWFAYNFDDALHVYKVYENNVLKSTLTDTNYTRTVVGQVENGTYARFKSDFTFRVDLCQADGTVLSTLTAEPWAVWYGSCAELPEPT